jgi:hypothetical protein
LCYGHPPDFKMGTEVEDTLTHADSPQRGNAFTARAFITLYNKYKYEIILCDVTHAGISRVR